MSSEIQLIPAGRRIRELDGVRGIAVLSVFVWHYFTCLRSVGISYGELPDLLIKCTYWCWAGVDLFFVLSGFLIGGIILDKHANPSFLKVFWVRRVCRIVPALSILLGSCVVFYAVLDRERYAWLFTDFMPWWSYPTFTQNFFMGAAGDYGAKFLSITWSLAIEEQFYLVAPLLILILGKRRWIQLVVPLIVLAAVLRHAFPGFQTNVNPWFRMDSLLCGVLLAALVRKAAAWRAVLHARCAVFAILLLLVPLTAWLLNADALGSMKFSWMAVVFTVFVLWALAYSGSRWTSFLRWEWLCFFGGISYGLYLYHLGVLGLLHGWLREGQPPSWQGYQATSVTIMAAIVSVLLSWFSFRYFESRFLNLARKAEYGDAQEVRGNA